MSFLRYVLILFIVILINSINCSTNTNDLARQSIYEKAIAELIKMENDLKRDQKQLKIDREKFEDSKKPPKPVKNTDVIRLNVGGKIIMTTRETLTRVPRSTLSYMFNGRWEHKLQRDKSGNIFFDFNPSLFHHLLDQLQTLETNDFTPPSESSLVTPFNKMLRKLGLHRLLSSEKHIISFNVGGQMLTHRETTFTKISNSIFDINVSTCKTTKFDRSDNAFLDNDPKLFQHLITHLRDESFNNISYFETLSAEEKTSFQRMISDLNIFRQLTVFPRFKISTKWRKNATTIAGGNGNGKQFNQLFGPEGIYIDDDDQSIYIADYWNHRIVEWKCDGKNGKVIAGIIGQGNRTDQLNYPTNVIVDKNNNSLIICDYENRRVLRWSRRNGRNGQIIISDIDCYGLTMNNDGDIYVSDYKKHEVRRWKQEDINGTIVAGGNGKGNNFNQFNCPTYIFVDKDHSIYVSDQFNHRVMKWTKGAKEGIVVAGGYGSGNSSIQLSYPRGVIVDDLGNVYVADSDNHRIMRWPKGSIEGNIILGSNGYGKQSNQFHDLRGLSFDRHGNLYVVDHSNHRIQKFNIVLN